MPIDKKTKLSIQKIRYDIGIVHCWEKYILFNFNVYIINVNVYIYIIYILTTSKINY